MRRRGLIVFAGAAIALLAAPPRVPLASIFNTEKYFDQRLERFDINDPLFMLGATRGVYLEGYGIVFTSELGLVTPPALTPFRPAISSEDKARLRQKKLARLPQLKKLMRDLMVHSANTMGEVPMEEQIVYSIALSYTHWEDTTDLPRQLLMQAKRRTLVDFEAGRLAEAGLIAAIRIQEN
jgi:hypothetical protein